MYFNKKILKKKIAGKQFTDNALIICELKALGRIRKQHNCLVNN